MPPIGAATFGNATFGNSTFGYVVVTPPPPPWPPPVLVGIPSPPPLRVEVRDANLNRVGQLADMIRLDMVETFNAVGRWQLDLPVSSNMAPFLMVPGSGILVIREDTGAVVFSGMTESPEETYAADSGRYTFRGRDDNGFLADRLAVPNPANPLAVSYAGNVISDQVYYAYNFWETAGQGAFDSGASNMVGTYLASGAPAAVDTWGKGSSPIVDDQVLPLGALLFGATGSMRHALVGLLGAALSIELWFYSLGWNGADGIVHGFWQNHDDAVLNVANGVSLFKWSDNNWYWRVTDASGTNHDISVSASSGIGAIVANTWNHVVGTFDATGSSLYLNGALIGTIGPFTLPTAGTPVVGGFARVGWAYASHSNSYLSHYAIYGKKLTTTQVAAHYAAAQVASPSYDVRTGTVEAVMRGYVGANAGASAIAARRVAGLILGTYNGLGMTLTERARFGNLLDLLRGLAIKGATASIPLGFHLRQIFGLPNQLRFDVYAPRDLTSRVIYSPSLQNIVAYTRKGPVAPAANYVFVGGNGLLSGRVVVGGQDATSVASWGRREVFRDNRTTGDPIVLNQTVSEELVKAAGKDELTLTPLSTWGLTYGIDFGLGDKVSVVTRLGDLLQEVVYEVETTIDDTGVRVLPRVGPPSALDPQQGTGILETIDQRIAKLEAQ